MKLCAKSVLAVVRYLFFSSRFSHLFEFIIWTLPWQWRWRCFCLILVQFPSKAKTWNGIGMNPASFVSVYRLLWEGTFVLSGLPQFWGFHKNMLDWVTANTRNRIISYFFQLYCQIKKYLGVFFKNDLCPEDLRAKKCNFCRGAILFIFCVQVWAININHKHKSGRLFCSWIFCNSRIYSTL